MIILRKLKTRTGFQFDVRGARPSDRPALAEFFTHVTQEDLRFRFLTAIKTVPHDFLVRMTEVDHDRTEDFLATGEDGRTIIATAMLAADADFDRAEVAIAVHRNYKKRGIGWTLLDHVARYAEAKGIRTLEAIESRDNRAAISLEREMGFTATSYPGDSTLMLVRKTLGAPRL